MNNTLLCLVANLECFTSSSILFERVQNSNRIVSCLLCIIYEMEREREQERNKLIYKSLIKIKHAKNSPPSKTESSSFLIFHLCNSMSTAENLVCYFKINSSIDPLFVQMLYIPSTRELEQGPHSLEISQQSSSVSSNLVKDSCACLRLVQGDHETRRPSLITFIPTLTFQLSHLCCSRDCSVCCCKPDRITAAAMNKYRDNQMVRILTESLLAWPNKTMSCFQIHAHSVHFSVSKGVFSKKSQVGE